MYCHYRRKKRSNASSKYRGVSYHIKFNKWQAHVIIERQLIHIGLYNTELECAKAFNQYVLDNKFDDIVPLNIIPEE